MNFPSLSPLGSVVRLPRELQLNANKEEKKYKIQNQVTRLRTIVVAVIFEVGFCMNMLIS